MKKLLITILFVVLAFFILWAFVSSLDYLTNALNYPVKWSDKSVKQQIIQILVTVGVYSILYIVWVYLLKAYLFFTR